MTIVYFATTHRKDEINALKATRADTLLLYFL